MGRVLSGLWYRPGSGVDSCVHRAHCVKRLKFGTDDVPRILNLFSYRTTWTALPVGN